MKHSAEACQPASIACRAACFVRSSGPRTEHELVCSGFLRSRPAVLSRIRALSRSIQHMNGNCSSRPGRQFRTVPLTQQGQRRPPRPVPRNARGEASDGGVGKPARLPGRSRDACPSSLSLPLSLFRFFCRPTSFSSPLASQTRPPHVACLGEQCPRASFIRRRMLSFHAWRRMVLPKEGKIRRLDVGELTRCRTEGGVGQKKQGHERYDVAPNAADRRCAHWAAGEGRWR